MKDNNEYNISGMNQKTYDLLFKDRNLPLPQEDTKTSDEIFEVIENFTGINNNTIYGKILRKIYGKIHHISFDKETKKYEYACNGKNIKFSIISDMAKDENMKKELQDKNMRKNRCHELTMKYLYVFSNPAKIVTGIYSKRGASYLHSVVELQAKSGNKIADFTTNTIMDKNQYIDLSQFTEIEELKDIEYLENVKEGIVKFLSKTNFMAKPYLVFKEEIKKDIQKNGFLLEKVDSEEIDARIKEINEIKEEYEKE